MSSKGAGRDWKQAMMEEKVGISCGHASNDWRSPGDDRPWPSQEGSERWVSGWVLKKKKKKWHATRSYAGSQKVCSQLFDLFLKTAGQKMCCHEKGVPVPLLPDIACLADTSSRWVRARAGFPLFVFWPANAVYSVLAVCDREAEEFSLRDVKFYLVRWTPSCLCALEGSPSALVFTVERYERQIRWLERRGTSRVNFTKTLEFKNKAQTKAPRVGLLWNTRAACDVQSV